MAVYQRESSEASIMLMRCQEQMRKKADLIHSHSKGENIACVIFFGAIENFRRTPSCISSYVVHVFVSFKQPIVCVSNWFEDIKFRCAIFINMNIVLEKKLRYPIMLSIT